MTDVNQTPISLPNGEKTAVRTQFGALCYRFKGQDLRVLLVTSRKSGLWILPKGWPLDGATPAQTALREAEEEAGAIGKVTGGSIGLYSDVKTLTSNQQVPCVIAIYPIKVKKLLRSYREKSQRKRKWFSLKRAASTVDNPELRQFLKDLDPHRLS